MLPRETSERLGTHEIDTGLLTSRNAKNGAERAHCDQDQEIEVI